MISCKKISFKNKKKAEFWGEGEDGGRVAEESTNGCLDAWQKLVEDSQNVAVRNVTMVEVVESRTVQHILPAVARIYSRLRQLGLPVMRLHSDRAREFTSLAVRRWAQARDIVVTKTSGDNYKANGRCECALGQNQAGHTDGPVRGMSQCQLVAVSCEACGRTKVAISIAGTWLSCWRSSTVWSSSLCVAEVVGIIATNSGGHP